MFKRIALGLAFAIVLIDSSRISAAPLRENVYLTRRVTQTNAGASMTLVNGQEDLFLPAGVTNNYGINKEMWVVINNGLSKLTTCWVEAGQKKGLIMKDLSQFVSLDPDNVPDNTGTLMYWSGHFVGYAQANPVTSYRELHAAPIGTMNPTGVFTYEIRPYSTGWEVKINGQQVLSVPAYRCWDEQVGGYYDARYSNRVDLGLEIKEDNVSYRSGTYIESIKVFDINTGVAQLVTNTSDTSTNPLPGAFIYRNAQTTWTAPTSTNQNNRITFLR